MIEREIRIEGMSCSHCVASVRSELSRLQGVTIKEVRIGSALVLYDETTVTLSQLNRAVETAGYAVLG
jgi:copper chaperone